MLLYGVLFASLQAVHLASRKHPACSEGEADSLQPPASYLRPDSPPLILDSTIFIPKAGSWETQLSQHFTTLASARFETVDAAAPSRFRPAGTKLSLLPMAAAAAGDRRALLLKGERWKNEARILPEATHLVPRLQHAPVARPLLAGRPCVEDIGPSSIGDTHFLQALRTLVLCGWNPISAFKTKLDQPDQTHHTIRFFDPRDGKQVLVRVANTLLGDCWRGTVLGSSAGGRSNWATLLEKAWYAFSGKGDTLEAAWFALSGFGATLLPHPSPAAMAEPIAMVNLRAAILRTRPDVESSRLVPGVTYIVKALTEHGAEIYSPSARDRPGAAPAAKLPVSWEELARITETIHCPSWNHGKRLVAMESRDEVAEDDQIVYPTIRKSHCFTVAEDTVMPFVNGDRPATLVDAGTRVHLRELLRYGLGKPGTELRSMAAPDAADAADAAAATVTVPAALALQSRAVYRPFDTTRPLLEGSAAVADIQQGWLADCYFLATLLSLLERGWDPQQAFVSNLREPGLPHHVVRFFNPATGGQDLVKVSSTHLVDSWCGEWVACRSQTGRVNWATVLEKAWFAWPARPPFPRDLPAPVNGTADVAMSALTGRAACTLMLDPSQKDTQIEQIIKWHAGAASLVFWTKDQLPETEAMPVGGWHVYSIVDAAPDGVQLNNPCHFPLRPELNRPRLSWDQLFEFGYRICAAPASAQLKARSMDCG